MPFQRILERLRYDVWFCTPGAYASMMDVVNICMERVKNGGSIDLPITPKMEGLSLHDLQARREMTIDRNGVANIHVLGVMGRGLSSIEKVCGRTDYADVEREAMEAGRSARGALFELDTPGGAAVGVDQAAKVIAGMQIPTAGYTETLLASAGVYLAAGLDRIFNSSGGVIGSVGAVLPWEDTSQAKGLLGHKTQVFTNKGATLKGICPDIPLTEEQALWLQEFTDFQGAMFRSHIEDYRQVDEEVFRAGLFFGEDAVRVGLADEVGGRDAAMEYLLTQMKQVT